MDAPFLSLLGCRVFGGGRAIISRFGDGLAPEARCLGSAVGLVVPSVIPKSFVMTLFVSPVGDIPNVTVFKAVP